MSTELTAIPERLTRLPELAYDLSWTWNAGRAVFRRLDYRLWRQTAHNPVQMLRLITPEALVRAEKDPVFLHIYDAALAAVDAMRSTAAAGRTWWQTTIGAPGLIAYFSAEFALHQSLPIYAGGLGVLAGDHCKEASDLGIPLVGVGFMYPQGYFRQRISADGWQQELYEHIDWDQAPVTYARTLDDRPCVVVVPLGTRSVLVQVWQVRLGRVRLLLLDTALEQNEPWDRELSARLYSGGQDMRLQQEIVLGLGGVLALRALGLEPAVWHLNEGHAAFVILQRLRDFLAAGRTWEEALVEVRRTTVFTTHTPVPAGHDAFSFHLVEQHLAGCWGSLNSHADQFRALGDYDSGQGPQFNMTALAMRSAGAINGVSQLHGRVTRQMFTPLWPDLAEDDRPISAITNGVHVPTWVSAPMATLFERHLSPAWRDQYEDADFWARILDIPDEELWAARQALRQSLFQFIREQARARWTEDQAAASRIVASGVMLDPEALTIGFARRFTGYKRPDLLFTDAERLARLVAHPGQPVQFVFAGKAHPADEAGKHHLQAVMRHALDPRLGGRIAFVDDYDLHVAHILVQGCDVWLNTPRKPHEASGTSGMKASMNGTLHLSIPDGWWAEGYTGSNGWAIVGAPDGDQDAADAEALYTLLEDAVVPTFYARDAKSLPHAWLTMVKQAILTITPRFSTRRMLKDYVAYAYGPAMTSGSARSGTTYPL
ncbi:MAG TPA: alpha-glucan family phosphorylase [Vicinamibacterales bacterium]|nr:alpha-glucan family phosphorylase [Vicinamibacterales bacterium]